MERRLVAILAADVVGYSRLMGGDEEATLATLNAYREVIDRLVADHHGRVFGSAGDSVIAEFASPVEAVRCAVKIQQELESRNAGLAEDRRMRFRIGVNLGDVVADNGNLHGDGVNIAARLEGLAEPGGVCVSGTVYDHLAGKLDLVLDDLGEQKLKNIARPVRVWRWVADVSAVGRHMSDAPLPLPDKPSIAVLPFTNLSDDPEQEFFADGMTEDIITELSRFRGLFVIAPSTAFSYKNGTGDPSHIALELGVRYLLKGSIRKVGNRIRISAQLIDASNQSHIWAERYDRDLEDIFAVQDEITRIIVSALEPELEEAERARAVSAPPERLDAWGAYHRGLWHVYRFTADDTREALSLFRRAIELDTSFAPGWSGKSFAHFSNGFLGYVEDVDKEIREALTAGRRSVELDPRDANAHWALARAYMLQRDYDRSIPEFETALTLNPNFAHGYYQLAWALIRDGRPSEALPNILTAERLSPNDPLRFAFHIARAQAYYLMKDFERALEAAEQAVRQPHAHVHIEVIRIAALVRTGHLEAAKAAAADLIQERPDYSLRLFSQSHGYRRQKDMQLYLDALTAAGVPE